MAIIDLIRKRTSKFSLAISANTATDMPLSEIPIAEIAAVAIANLEIQRTGVTHFLSAEDEQAVRKWLIQIGELDAVVITQVLHDCHKNLRARAYILNLAKCALEQDPPVTNGFNDDRRTCNECKNLVGRQCLAAKRGEITASRNHEPIRDMLQRCKGYLPNMEDPDRRPGRERWPGLT